MIAKIVLATITLLALLNLASVAHAQSATVAQRKEKRIADCTLESTSLDDCDMEGYLARALVFSLPGLIIAVCFLLICPFYCCSKYCCNCCGGRNQSPNFCCPNTELPARYSTGDIIRPKVLMILALAVAVASLIWSLVGVSLIVGGVDEFITAVVDIPTILTAEINVIGDSLIINLWDTSTNETRTERLFDTSGKSVKENAEKTRDDLKKMIDDQLAGSDEIMKDVQNVLWVLFIVPLVLIGLGTFFGICNCRKYLPMSMVWFLFLFGFLMWLGHFVFSLGSMVVGDVCAEVSGLANKQLNLVSVLASCDDSMFSDFKTSFRELEITQSEKTCNQMVLLCWEPAKDLPTNLAEGNVYQCPTDLSCPGMTFARLIDLMETSFFIHPEITNRTNPNPGLAQFRCNKTDEEAGGPCTVARCADDCIQADAGYRYPIGQSSKTIYIAFTGAKTISNVIDTLGARYATCDSVMSIIIAPFDEPCQTVTNGLIYDRQASGLMGLAIIGAMFVFAWGAKRFIPLNQAEKAQREGLDGEQDEQIEG